MRKTEDRGRGWIHSCSTHPHTGGRCRRRRLALGACSTRHEPFDAITLLGRRSGGGGQTNPAQAVFFDDSRLKHANLPVAHLQEKGLAPVVDLAVIASVQHARQVRPTVPTTDFFGCTSTNSQVKRAGTRAVNVQLVRHPTPEEKFRHRHSGFRLARCRRAAATAVSGLHSDFARDLCPRE